MLPSHETRLNTRASAYRCQDCPPDRVCAWACTQGANLEEIVAGAVLMEEGKLAPAASRVEPEIKAVSDEICVSYD